MCSGGYCLLSIIRETCKQVTANSLKWHTPCYAKWKQFCNIVVACTCRHTPQSMNAISSLFSAFGLSTAAGLNAYIPLLVVGVLGRYAPGLVQLNAPFDILTNPWLLIVLGLIAILDFVGDKIPAIDHGLHAIGVVVNPIAGALVALAANSDAGAVNPVLAAVCGLLLAGGAHAARATARPIATATTAGIGNPVLSFMEDITSLVLSVLALLLPALAFLLVLVLAILVFWGIRRVTQRRRMI